MTNPFTKYLKNLFAKKRIIGDDKHLGGLVKADALLNNLINDKKIPGLAISVIMDGKLILQKGYGYADLESKIPVDARRTVFRIASVSKPIAATALAHMVDEGLINLDASFYDYVPYYPKKEWDFSIRQLASHTAGIRGYQGTEYGLNKPYSIKESITIFKDDDLLFEPGTNYLYSSYDWVLISLAMEEASGIPFETYVQNKVLTPLKMTTTFTERQKISRKAKFYSKNRLGFREAIPVNSFFKLAGGGYLSTSVDIIKFGQAYLENKVLNKEVITPFLSSETINENKTYYGLGWQVSEDEKGRPYHGHVGNGVGSYSNFFIYPEQQMVFSILINCTNPQVQDELNTIIAVILDSDLRC